MGLVGLAHEHVLELNIEDGVLEVEAVVSHPFAPGTKAIRLKGMIDTGSFVTIIPHQLVGLLGLRPEGELVVRPLWFSSLDASSRLAAGQRGNECRPTYLIEVRISAGSESFPARRVFAVCSHQTRLIIGRDLLRWFTLHYYGKAALNPAHSDDVHDPMAVNGFFGLGAGINRAASLR